MSALEKSLITLNPTSDYSIVSRRRIFSLSQLRSDFRDALTQFLLLLTQLHEEKFTGAITLNFSQGRICNVESLESKKINTNPDVV